MSETKLKPCPFCGSRQIGLDKTKDDILNLVVCENCNSRVSGATKESAIKKWNTRKPMDNIVAELEHLQKLNFEAWGVSTHMPDKIGYAHTSNAYANAVVIVKRGGVE